MTFGIDLLRLSISLPPDEEVLFEQIGDQYAFLSPRAVSDKSVEQILNLLHDWLAVNRPAVYLTRAKT